jgi:hypothetical protein
MCENGGVEFVQYLMYVCVPACVRSCMRVCVCVIEKRDRDREGESE